MFVKNLSGKALADGSLRDFQQCDQLPAKIAFNPKENSLPSRASTKPQRSCDSHSLMMVFANRIINRKDLS